MNINTCKYFHNIYCNEVRKYGKKEAGTGEHLNTFNNKINKHKWKAAAPHGRLPHTKHQLKFQAWSSLVFHCCHSSFNPSEAPPWDSRPVSGAGVVHYQLLHRPRSVPTALGPAPLVTYPHRPSQAGGYSRDCALLPPSPLSRGEPVRAAAAYLGVRTDEAREKETEGWGVTETREGREEKKKKISVRFPDTLPLGPQPAERFTRGAMRWYWTSLVDGPIPLPPGGRRWLLRSRAAGSESPVPCSSPNMANGSRLRPPGERGDSSAPSRTAATPPRPRSTAASLPSHLFFHCSSTTASDSHWRSPLLPAARSPQHRDPPQQRGLSDSVSLLPPGFRHQCNEVRKYGKKEAGTGEHLNTFNNKINKHKWKAAAPHGRLPHTKHQLKTQAWSLSRLPLLSLLI